MKSYLCKECGTEEKSLFYETNMSTCKPCIRDRNKVNYSKLTSKQRAHKIQRTSKWQDDNMLRYRFISARGRAKHKNIEFSITLEDLQQQLEVQRGKCFYTGKEMRIARNERNTTVSIDRMNNDLGYTKTNIVLCCSIINNMKTDLNLVDFKVWCSLVTCPV